MKKIIIFGLTLLLVSTCKKDKYPWGTACALKNGEEWNAKSIVVPNKPYGQGISILIQRTTKKGTLSEQFILFKIPFEEGTYQLDSTSSRDIDTLSGASLSKIIGGDVASSLYELLEDSSAINEVVIEEINGNEIKGTFEVSLKNKNLANGNPLNNPDPAYIIFKNGVFETTYVEDE